MRVNAIGIVIGILALFIVGAVALQLVDDVIPSDHEWEYDDYKHVEGATSATGSLELVDTHLGPMVHAIDVGPGSIVLDDGSVTEVDVHRAILDVYLITGQSNSAYYQADPSEAEPLPGIGEAYAWINAAGGYGHNYPGPYRMADVVDPVTGEANVGDKCPSFCSTVNSITGHKVYWICGGWGGVSINTFNPDGGAAWVYMAETVSDAMSAIDSRLYDASTQSFMWIQGETDRTMPVTEYEQKFVRIVDSIVRGDLGWKFDHCYVSLITERHGGNARQAQLDAASGHPSRITIATEVADTFTEENGLMSSDGIHYTQAGDNIIGVDLGTACGRASSSTGLNIMGLVPILLVMAMVVMALGLVLRGIRT